MPALCAASPMARMALCLAHAQARRDNLSGRRTSCPSLPGGLGLDRGTNCLCYKGKRLEPHWHGLCSLQEGEPPAPCRAWGGKRSDGAQADTGESKAEEQDWHWQNGNPLRASQRCSGDEPHVRALLRRRVHAPGGACA